MAQPSGKIMNVVYDMLAKLTTPQIENAEALAVSMPTEFSKVFKHQCREILRKRKEKDDLLREARKKVRAKL